MRPLIVARGLLLAGVVVSGAGVALLVLPGPGWLLVAVGAVLVAAGLASRLALR